MTYQEIAFETVTVDRQGQIIDREQRRAQQFVEALASGVILELIVIPAARSLMGSAQGRGYDDERSQHRVKVAPFLMGKHPVTEAQWAAVMGQHTGRFSGDLRPVENVSWDAAQTFCRRLTNTTGRHTRLPGEAEWEYACRGGTTTPFSYGWTITTELANYNGLFTFAASRQASTATRPRRPAASRRTRSGCMTCTATCGNGAPIRGMRAMPARRLTGWSGRPAGIDAARAARRLVARYAGCLPFRGAAQAAEIRGGRFLRVPRGDEPPG